MGRKKKWQLQKQENRDILPISVDDILQNKIISQDVVDTTRDQLKVFLVAQARRELIRVIKLTETLDKIQDRYQDKVLEYMANHDDETAISYLPVMIETITKCLENSYNIITRVVGNDKIMTFQVVQNNVEVGSVSSTVVGSLEDPISREKVRKAVAEILNSLPEGNNEEVIV